VNNDQFGEFLRDTNMSLRNVKARDYGTTTNRHNGAAFRSTGLPPSISIDNQPTSVDTLSVVTPIRDGGSRKQLGPTSGIAWEPLADVEMKAIRFADRPLYQHGAFHLLVGRKGVGKGTHLAQLAARVTRGVFGEMRHVIWIGSEDSNAIDVRPRIVAAGGDVASVTVVKSGHIRLPEHVDEIRRKALELGGVGLVLIDPVSNHIGSVDTDREGQVRHAIAPLNDLADELDTLVVGVRHIGKDASRGAMSSVLGSVAWVQVPRAVLVIAADDEDEAVRHVHVVGGNRTSSGEGRAFRIEPVTLPGLEEPVTKAVDVGVSLKDADSLLEKPRQDSRSAKARDLILDILEAEGEMDSDTLDARVARETGLSAATSKNQRKALVNAGLVKPFPHKDELGKVTSWRVFRTAAPRA
jgi:hypothetical protein